jgi:transcriptional regulator with XRE-family HTH domain
VADFGQEVRRLRTAARLSLRKLAAHAGIDWGYLGQIERGERRCSIDFAEILDQALNAGGALIDAWEVDMRRRQVLSAAAALPVAGSVMGVASLAVGAEVLRQDLVATLGTTARDWEEIAWQYAREYFTTAPPALMTDLETDLLVAGTQLRKASDEATRRTLHRAIGLLAAFTACTAGNLGDLRGSLRWWRTAREYADASRDAETRVWVRGREIVQGLYERRPLPYVLNLADEAMSIAASPGMGTCHVAGARAQALAMLGRAAEARAALSDVHDAFERLPDRVNGDSETMWGFSEQNLRHTETFVYTYLGDDRRAEEAHDQALRLYPEHRTRSRAQVQLHRALRMTRTGDTAGGTKYAHETLEALPAEHRIEAVREVARSVVAAVPAAQRHQPPVAQLREMLAPPSTPSA